MPDAQQMQQLNRTAVQVVHTYQSTYRSAVQYATATVRGATLQATLGNWVPAYALGVAGGAESTYLTELYAAGKCVLHILARTVPSWSIAKLFKFVG